MIKHEVKCVIFDMLEGILTETGFRLKKSEDAFVRKFEGGRQIIGIPLWDYNPQFEYSLNVCIRLDAVESIFNRFSGSQPKHHPSSLTTITTLEYFTGDSGRRKVESVADLTNSLKGLSSVIQGRIIPFLNELQDVQALDAAVNCQSPGIDITQYPAGAMHSVILAYLSRNKNFERVVTKHRDVMQLTQGTPHAFNDLINYLKSN